LIDTVVVEPDGHAARGKKNGNPIADDESPRMVHLEPATTVELDHEDAERLNLSEALKTICEIVSGHASGLAKRDEPQFGLTWYAVEPSSGKRIPPS
jgi:hypothetical protein